MLDEREGEKHSKRINFTNKFQIQKHTVRILQAQIASQSWETKIRTEQPPLRASLFINL
jgi:hypothetical protein